MQEPPHSPPALLSPRHAPAPPNERILLPRCAYQELCDATGLLSPRASALAPATFLECPRQGSRPLHAHPRGRRFRCPRDSRRRPLLIALMAGHKQKTKVRGSHPCKERKSGAPSFVVVCSRGHPPQRV